MNKNVIKVIACIIIIIAVENVAVVKIFSNRENSILVSGNGISQKIAIDAKSIAINQKMTTLKTLALKNILNDKSIDKEVEKQLNLSIKGIGTEQAFQKYLKSINMDSTAYKENLAYNLLFNKALEKEKSSIAISDGEILDLKKGGYKEAFKKTLKLYSSSDNNFLLDIQKRIEKGETIKNSDKLHQGVIDVGEINKDFWNVIKDTKDGSCAQIIISGNNKYLAYNVLSIPETQQLKQLTNGIKEQKAIVKINAKIDAEIKTFNYKLN